MAWATREAASGEYMGHFSDISRFANKLNC